MNAFHTLWTRPYTASHPGQPFAVTDFDLLCTILSAMEWRAHNGSIRLYTDRMGDRYVSSCGLAVLWDGGIEAVLDDIPYTVDPTTFWAAGKLYALDRTAAPCVMLDTDFIVWKPLKELLSGADAAVIHREELNPDIYPDPSCFVCEAGYRYPAGWDFRLPACNTALCFLGSEALRKAYCGQSLEFIRASRGRDALHYMVFAEQRILPMCAEQHGFQVRSLSELGELFFTDQQYFTHLWGYKQLLLQNPEERAQFCRRCAVRIARDYRPLLPVCRSHPLLKQYFAGLSS